MTMPTPRNHGLDDLRGALTLLVVLHHAAITYGGQGGWFYQEIRPGNDPSSLLLTVFCAVNQAWFMGAFFLIAGYFTPAALARRGGPGFARERLLRLGLPLLAFVLVLGPLTVALALTARGRPMADTLAAIARNMVFIPGPMWFVMALLIFSAGAMLWGGLTRGRSFARVRPFPSDSVMLAAAIFTGTLALILRQAWPVGVSVAGLQFGYFASYVVLFVAGCMGAAGGWLEGVPPAQRRRWAIVALAALPVLPLAVLAAPLVPALQASPNGGISLPAVLYAVWEPLVAWGLILLALAWAARMGRPGGGPPGPVRAGLRRRAYAIYVIHPPVLVGIALLLREVPAPALVKFAVTGSLACAACFVLAGLLLRVRGVARVL